jgi:hypothetical protein
MIPKTNHIGKLANLLASQGRTMTFDQLASDLNANGFKTTRGAPYQGGRGVAKLVDAVYWRLDAQGRLSDRDDVAQRFTDANGDYAY